MAAPSTRGGMESQSLPPGACRRVSCFAKGNKLGEGTYGSVYCAIDKESSTRVALKRVKLSGAGFEREGMPQTSLREIGLLKRLKHPNIVSLLEVVVGNRADSVFLVFEYCEHDLSRLIDTMPRPFGHGEVKWMLSELLQAIGYLHAHCVMHRDLKVSNILLTGSATLKLCDFGLARSFSRLERESYTAKMVTLWYRAPELLFGSKEYGPPVDMWSVGCILGELLLHRPLLPASTEAAQVTLLCELLGAPSARIWPEVDGLPLWGKLSLPDQPYNELATKFAQVQPGKPALDILNKMLTYDPKQRITAAEAQRHAYLISTVPPVAERPRSHMIGRRGVSSGSASAPMAAAASSSHDSTRRQSGQALKRAMPPPDEPHEGAGSGRNAPRAEQRDSVGGHAVGTSVRLPSPCDVAASTMRFC